MIDTDSRLAEAVRAEIGPAIDRLVAAHKGHKHLVPAIVSYLFVRAAQLAIPWLAEDPEQVREAIFVNVAREAWQEGVAAKDVDDARAAVAADRAAGRRPS